MKIKPVVSRPVKIAVIGAGNRADKYLEYARRYPGRLQLVAVVELNELAPSCDGRPVRTAGGSPLCELRRFLCRSCRGRYGAGFDAGECPFRPGHQGDRTPDTTFCSKKPIAQRLDECREIARRARERGESGSECAMCCAIILILPKSGNWSLPASSDGSSPSITLHRSDWTGLHIAMCVGFSAGCAKRIPSCWPNAVTTSTSCCG